MKKLFKILWVLELVGALRGHRRHGHHGRYDHDYGHRYDYGHRRSRSHYPLHYRSHRHSLIEHALRRLLGGRRY